jgi:hypothetical protein
MAVRRSLNKSVSVSKQVNRLSLLSQLLFTWAIPHLDDWGCISGDPDEYAATVCPMKKDLTTEQIADCLREQAEEGLIYWYEVNGIPIVFYPKFEQHQDGLHKRTKSGHKYPTPDECDPDDIKPLYPFTEIPGNSEKFPPKRNETKRNEINNVTDGDEPQNQIYVDLAEHLKQRILENKPDARTPNDLSKWATSARLIVERDNRTPERIRQVIDWCQKDDFWKSNILSMDKLRAQFDRLEMQMSRASPKKYQKPERVRTSVPGADATREYLERLAGGKDP